MPCHHEQHTQNVGPNLFVHNENAMWYHTCDDIMHASQGMHTQASQPPYVYVACQELLMDVPFAQAEQYI